ncbi:MAG: UTP--glucose-1-phosphate uridylyltransferase [Gammaproteobacteria bacterium]
MTIELKSRLREFGINMKSFSAKFTPFAERMLAESLPEIAIETFRHYYLQLLEGNTGTIAEQDIRPVSELVDAESIVPEVTGIGEKAVSRTVLIKLNGGLGTSMGLDRAKSLLRIKGNLSFLDIIARQAIRKNIPLILMNSFATREDSLAALKPYPELWNNDLDIDFVQHKIPKINKSDMGPVDWPRAPHLEWCPPGHGDLYIALFTSGQIERLLDRGYEYAFVSNADNLGAVLDTAILGYFAEQHIPLLMEVTERTQADKKGGHLARMANGQLLLRESAQCLPEEMSAFQDITRHKFFNTNNLWLNLRTLESVMAEKKNILGLPLIRNEKTVDPGDAGSPPVYQLETAMGSAISVFDGAQAIRVPRTRFFPVKTTSDLMTIRSDAYCLTDDCRLIINP